MAKAKFNKNSLLKPSTMRSVAERRFRDANALIKTRDNERANGAVYLAGYVVEILLKALLVETHPAVARATPGDKDSLSKQDQRIWRLIWRDHDLSSMLVSMQWLEVALLKASERNQVDYLGNFKRIAATWTIQMRYS